MGIGGCAIRCGLVATDPVEWAGVAAVEVGSGVAVTSEGEREQAQAASKNNKRVRPIVRRA
jgi:hypothetical protein